MALCEESRRKHRKLEKVDVQGEKSSADESVLNLVVSLNLLRYEVASVCGGRIHTEDV